MDLSPLHERMHAVAGSMSYRALGDYTSQHPETVRRYMQGQAPSVEFLAALCSRFDLNAQWLLTGRGPQKQSDAKAHALREANPSELLSAVAEALERLTERVDRIELFVQTMETRLRGSMPPLPTSAPPPPPTPTPLVPPLAGIPRDTPQPLEPTIRRSRGNPVPAAPSGAGDDPAARRARLVADALPQRPSQDTR